MKFTKTAALLLIHAVKIFPSVVYLCIFILFHFVFNAADFSCNACCFEFCCPAWKALLQPEGMKRHRKLCTHA